MKVRLIAVYSVISNDASSDINRRMLLPFPDTFASGAPKKNDHAGPNLHGLALAVKAATSTYFLPFTLPVNSFPQGNFKLALNV